MEATDSTPERMVREALRLDRENRVPEAIVAYRRVLTRWPALGDCWYRLAALERKSRNFSAALSSYQLALDHGVKRPEEVHLNRGVLYSEELRQNAAAEREFKSALALNPAYVPALINIAGLHEDVGRREQALATYEQILALDPDSLQALARYANATSFTSLDDPLIGRMKRVLAGSNGSAEDRAGLGFALGRAQDACGDYAAAFDTYNAANQDSRAGAVPGTARYERSAAEGFVDRLIAAYPASSPRVSALPSSPRPIFVCGMFRSGSTLVEQLLAGHPRVTAGGELDFLPYIAQSVLAPFPESIALVTPQRLETLAAEYIGAIGKLFPGADLVTDKRPDNFLYIGLIKRLFPDARIVHTTRDPLDNCLSLFFLHLDHRMSYALDLMDIGHHYRLYLRLMAHWKTLFGPDILDVPYDALVREPKSVVEPLLNFLGLEWDDRCLTVPRTGRAVKTASVWQVREPLYVRSSGRARHYAGRLAALRDYIERDWEK